MHGEFQRTDPRIFARPLTIRRGQRVTLPQMIDRLNDLGYAQRPPVEQPGEFAIGRDALAIIPRSGDQPGKTMRLVFAPVTPRSVRSPARRRAPTRSTAGPAAAGCRPSSSSGGSSRSTRSSSTRRS